MSALEDSIGAKAVAVARQNCNARVRDAALELPAVMTVEEVAVFLRLNIKTVHQGIANGARSERVNDF